MKKKKKQHVPILLLLFIVGLLLFSFARSRQTGTERAKSLPATSPTEETESLSSSKPFITCQTTVTTRDTTTELFTYTLENKFRADYRVKTNGKQIDYSSQIYFDGRNIYFWNPTVKQDFLKETENTSGFFKRAVSFDAKTDVSKLDSIERFDDSGISGVHVCKERGPDDPVFQLPFNIRFSEYPDYLEKIRANIRSICTPCGQIKDDGAASACKKNLGCNL